MALWLTRAVSFLPSPLPSHQTDLKNGEQLFHIGGCLSCHASGIKDENGLPVGGKPLPSPVGAFYPPNITPDKETGIGSWSDTDFVVAMTAGVSPDGRHYFPSFPYTSYQYMSYADLLDLKAYLFSLPPVRHEIRHGNFPLESLLRAFIGLWKWWSLPSDRPFLSDLSKGAEWNRGAYLVQGPGHCAACHTPRNFLMMLKGPAHFLLGGRHPEGNGTVPSLRGLITRGRYKDADDLAFALMYGEGFGYDTLSSGGMGDVRLNLSKAQETDIKAISAFLTSLP
ncbi:MAG: cytochrome c [Alphaproteobacteria bacterium]|nr:cytochrome c [Alphaproteobacteria bacterium]